MIQDQLRMNNELITAQHYIYFMNIYKSRWMCILSKSWF